MPIISRGRYVLSSPPWWPGLVYSAARVGWVMVVVVVVVVVYVSFFWIVEQSLVDLPVLVPLLHPVPLHSVCWYSRMVPPPLPPPPCLYYSYYCHYCR